MSAYTLTVCHEGQALPTETVSYATAAQALEGIKPLLLKHPGCHRIRVHAGLAFLFAVDCKGETVKD